MSELCSEVDVAAGIALFIDDFEPVLCACRLEGLETAAAEIVIDADIGHLAQFQLVGKQRGNFVVSIRLLAPPAPPLASARP